MYRLACLVLLLFSSTLNSAPAPFPKKEPVTLKTTLQNKNWLMYWSSMVYTVTLEKNGYYEADNKFMGKFFGSWQVVDNVLIIIETTDMERDWLVHHIDLNPITLEGKLRSDYGTQTVTFKKYSDMEPHKKK